MWSYVHPVPRRQRVSAASIRGPRKHLAYPDEFGITAPAEPTDELAPSERYKADAALVQHDLARQIIEQMARHGITYPVLAKQIGVSVEQLRRMLRGESGMSFERMHQLAKAVGLSITVTIERTE